jgi:hypothetical protein
VATPQTLNDENSPNHEVVGPTKARACDALHAVLRNRSREQKAESRVMRRGAERC